MNKCYSLLTIIKIHSPFCLLWIFDFLPSVPKTKIAFHFFFIFDVVHFAQFLFSLIIISIFHTIPSTCSHIQPLTQFNIIQKIHKCTFISAFSQSENIFELCNCKFNFVVDCEACKLNIDKIIQLREILF